MKKQAWRGWVICPISHNFGGRQTFAQVCYLRQRDSFFCAKLPHCLSVLILMKAHYFLLSDMSLGGRCLGGVVCGPNAPPRSTLPAGHLSPKCCSAGWWPRLAVFFSRELPSVISLISGSASRKHDSGQGGTSGVDHINTPHRTKISTRPEARAAFWSSANIFIIFSHKIGLESVGTFSSKKSSDYFFRFLLKCFVKVAYMDQRKP